MICRDVSFQFLPSPCTEASLQGVSGFIFAIESNASAMRSFPVAVSELTGMPAFVRRAIASSTLRPAAVLVPASKCRAFFFAPEGFLGIERYLLVEFV